jgi:hypothetical protein
MGDRVSQDRRQVIRGCPRQRLRGAKNKDGRQARRNFHSLGTLYSSEGFRDHFKIHGKTNLLFPNVPFSARRNSACAANSPQRLAASADYAYWRRWGGPNEIFGRQRCCDT